MTRLNTTIVAAMPSESMAMTSDVENFWRASQRSVYRRSEPIMSACLSGGFEGTGRRRLNPRRSPAAATSVPAWSQTTSVASRPRPRASLQASRKIASISSR